MKSNRRIECFDGDMISSETQNRAISVAPGRDVYFNRYCKPIYFYGYKSLMPDIEKKSIAFEDKDTMRLDKFIVSRFPERSRSFWQNMIKGEHVLVNGIPAKANYKLRTGDTIEVAAPEPVSEIPEPEHIPLDIVHEDEHILVVNKQPGLVVHPAAGNREHTLVNALLHHCPDIEISGHAQRPGIVHRLDKETSGIMVVAKTHKAYLDLVRQIADRDVSRRYKAIVIGYPEPPEGKVEAPIGRHRLHRTKMSINLATGKPSVTHYRVIEYFNGLSLVEVALETGRTHQIRVHMTHIGRPVLGDPEYGYRSKQLMASLPRTMVPEVKSNLASIKRQMLHAYSLSFRHPATDERVSYEAVVPEDFQDVLNLLREKAPPE
jgi:23S rRNA pseudouridine1911/1915/1917 synthase